MDSKEKIRKLTMYLTGLLKKFFYIEKIKRKL